MAQRIPQEFIQNLLAHSDIVETIQAFVPLQKKGVNFSACCPFHDEKTPSFSVSPNKQFYHCFGCGANGNAISFLMQHARMDFIEAVEKLALQAGVRIPYQDSGTNIMSVQRKRLLQTLETAATLFQSKLHTVNIAKKYLHKRGINQETAERFKLGYAPPGYDSMQSLFGKDYDKKLLLDAGLLKEKDGQCYAQFRNRLMFPIRNPRGQTIAFGGRTLTGEKQPKYLNSPETPVFQKRRALYGIHELRRAKKLESVLVVEGYMDAITLVQNGIENVTATLGTAVTPEHAQQLFRLCSTLTFCFDGDAAGYKAAATALRQVLPTLRDGREIRFMLLPRDEDPDSLVAREGPGAFTERVLKAMPLSDFLFRHLSENLDLMHPEGRASFSLAARSMLKEIPPGTLRDLLTEDLAMRARLDLTHLKSAPSPMTSPRRPHAYNSRRHYSNVRISTALLIHNPQLADKALSEDRIRKLNEPGSTVLADMIQTIKTCRITKTSALIEQFRGHEYQETISDLVIWTPPPDDHAEFVQCMKQLQKLLSRQRVEYLIEKAYRSELTVPEKTELQALQKAGRCEVE